MNIRPASTLGLPLNQFHKSIPLCPSQAAAVTACDDQTTPQPPNMKSSGGGEPAHPVLWVRELAAAERTWGGRGVHAGGGAA